MKKQSNLCYKDAIAEQLVERVEAAFADSDSDLARLYRFEVEIEGLSVPCRIWEAAEGDAALRIARRERPDLVLLDIVLPGSSVSGVLVCQELCRDIGTKSGGMCGVKIVIAVRISSSVSTSM